MSGVTSANVRACATGVCGSDASPAEAATSACIWRLVHSEVRSSGSPEHLSIFCFLCLMF